MKKLISSRNFDQETINSISNTIEIWSDKINKMENFSFIKFGDGEFFCMMGEEGQNCDKHPYSKELSEKLYDSWYFFNTLENIYIAEWAGHKPGMVLKTSSEKFQLELMNKTTQLKVNFVNFEILLQNLLSEQKFNFFKNIKYSSRKKIFVGPERLFGVKNFLNFDSLIKVPLVNSFSKYDDILSNIKNELVDNCIVVTSSGMPSKSLIHKSLEFNNNITCLDIGSGFDALCYGNTREGQLSPTAIRKYYEDL